MTAIEGAPAANAKAGASVCILGLGAIGGSLALALVQRGARVRAYSLSADDRRLAERAGIGVAGSAVDSAVDATMVVLAVPIGQLGGALRELLPALDPHCVVAHVGSVQARRAFALTDAEWSRVIGTHPLAGSHESGFSAARADLFAGAAVSVESRASHSVRRAVEALWVSAGAREIVYRDAEEHDRLMAWVSHLPQLAATALASTLAERGLRPADLGPGARDTTRLAASALELWQPIICPAQSETLRAVEALEDALRDLRRVLATGDPALLANSWERAADWRRAVEAQG